MSIRSSSRRHLPSVQARPRYLQGFLREVHRLLWLAYQRLQPRITELQASLEEDLSEALVNAMDQVIEDRHAPRWAQRYATQPEYPISHPDRHGKGRPQIDIQLRRTQRGRHPRFHFSAKRLCQQDRPSDDVGEYVDRRRGVIQFLNGEYAAECDDAGMLGYVQVKSPEFWASRLETRFGSRKGLHVLPNGKWAQHQVVRELPHTYRTHHQRPSLGRTITIYHTLLVFCAPESS